MEFKFASITAAKFSSRFKTRYSSLPLPFISFLGSLGRTESLIIRHYSARASRNPKSLTANAKNTDEFREIMRLVHRGEPDMELKLNQMNLRLSCGLISDVLLSSYKHEVSALRFFTWVKTKPSFSPSPDIYNQIVDVLGRLGDFDGMLVLLYELSAKQVCLTEKAFDFLKFRNGSIRVVVKRISEILISVRGSCRGSGIHSLIMKLAALSLFNLAVFVMEETVRKTSYYNVLIAAKCRIGEFVEAREILEEMKRFGCDPNTKSYNYLLGSLCKNGKIVEACNLLEMMEDMGYFPDQITFEVLVYHACRIGRIDFAVEFLNRMMVEGLEPRLTTNAVVIKGYFCSGQFQNAHRFVVDMSEKHKCSANLNYSLLASLYLQSGKVFEVQSILIEMIEKGLKPNFPVYIKTVKGLYHAGRKDLAGDLKIMFSKFNASFDTKGG